MNTEQLLRDIKARISHTSSKEYLKEKYHSKLIFADQGGLWKASPELLAYLRSEEDELVIILDSYDNPIMVNRIDLYDKMYKVYNDAMGLWYSELKELENKR